MTIVTPAPTTADSAVQRFVDLTPQRVKELLYGALHTAADLADLEVIAAATGVDSGLLVPATGRIGEDPRTGHTNPHASAAPETPLVNEPDEPVEDLVEEEHLEDDTTTVMVGVAPQPQRRAMYTVTVTMTCDLIETAVRGRRLLAAWARNILAHRDLVVPHVAVPAVGVS